MDPVTAHVMITFEALAIMIPCRGGTARTARAARDWMDNPLWIFRSVCRAVR